MPRLRAIATRITATIDGRDGRGTRALPARFPCPAGFPTRPPRLRVRPVIAFWGRGGDPPATSCRNLSCPLRPAHEGAVCPTIRSFSGPTAICRPGPWFCSPTSRSSGRGAPAPVEDDPEAVRSNPCAAGGRGCTDRRARPGCGRGAGGAGCAHAAFHPAGGRARSRRSRPGSKPHRSIWW